MPNRPERAPNMGDHEMSSYTVKNLKDVEDAAAARTSEVEARFARKHLDSRELGVSYFRYGPGFRSKMGHSHREQEEVYIVTSGSGRIKLDGDILDLHRWDVVRVAPEVVRAFEGGPEGLELVVVGSSRPEDGDGVPAPDWWTD
jgi:mannose-6-phosphate isomerase-like protein (cupin superfamily)